MTDKQIIIDNVDVSGCEFYLPYSEKCECIVDDNGNNNLFCREYRDCYYKRMYHTGQEKDIYKNENKELYKLLTAKEQECERLKEEIAKATMEICNQCGEKDDYNIPCKQIRDLDYGLQLEIEENDKLKQTLAEIKEIAEKHKATAHCCYLEDMTEILQKINECEVGDENSK